MPSTKAVQDSHTHTPFTGTRKMAFQAWYQEKDTPGKQWQEQQKSRVLRRLHRKETLVSFISAPALWAWQINQVKVIPSTYKCSSSHSPGIIALGGWTSRLRVNPIIFNTQ